MPVEEAPLDLIFGLEKNDLLKIGGVIVLGFFALALFAVVITLVSYVLSRIFERKDDSLGHCQTNGLEPGRRVP